MTFWNDSIPNLPIAMSRKGSNHSIRKEEFDPQFPSMNNVSEDSDRRGYADSVPYQVNGENTSNEALRKIRTAGNISISPELFEKIYLSPQKDVKGDLRSTFANPTPIGLLGFVLSLSPLACELMGWRGAGEAGIAGVGSYYFIVSIDV